MTVATKTAYLPDGAIASAVLKKSRNIKSHSFVYGTLLIENNSKEIERVNLNCFYLENDQLSSKDIYVDSIASVLPTQYPAKNGNVKVDVYWAFKQPPEVEKGFSLALRHPLDQSRPCLTYKP